MQRYRPLVFLPFALFLMVTASAATEDPIPRIRQLADLVYRSSQDMVMHGSEGHTWEIVLYGKKMVQRAEILLEKVEAADSAVFKRKKGKIIASVKETLKKAKEAVALGEQDKGRMALTAARKASFRAKQTRQRLHSIR
ncbi:MAG: hypothetical protein ACE5F7_06050 [Nitrospiria bacterium]